MGFGQRMSGRPRLECPSASGRRQRADRRNGAPDGLEQTARDHHLGHLDYDGFPVAGMAPPVPAPAPGMFDDLIPPSLTKTPVSWTESVPASMRVGFRGNLLGSATDWLATRLAPDTTPWDPNTGQRMSGPTPREQVRRSINDQDERDQRLPLQGGFFQGLGDLGGSGISRALPAAVRRAVPAWVAPSARASGGFFPAWATPAGLAHVFAPMVGMAPVKTASDAARQAMDTAAEKR
jgi:hypothetical protein